MEAMDNLEILIPLILAIVCCVALLSVALRMRKGTRVAMEHAERLSRITHMFQTDESLEKNLERILELVSEYIQAPTYTFYLFDEKNQKYVLRAIRQATGEFGVVAPSYSGLVEYQKEKYLSPLSVAQNAVPNEVGIVTDGDVPIYSLPFGERKGVIRIGPLRRTRRPKNKHDVMQLLRDLEPLLDVLVKIDRLAHQKNTVVASAKALQNISGVTSNPSILASIVLHACIANTRANGGVVIELLASPQIIAASSDTAQLDLGEASTVNVIKELSTQHESIVIRRGQQEYYLLPKMLIAQGGQSFFICRVSENYVLVLWGDDSLETTERLLDQTKVLFWQFHMLTQRQIHVQQANVAYTDILKHLAIFTDFLNPFTGGYSELMARYAVVIAEKLGLPDDEIRDIGLAAYLSNIGVLGLSSELFHKTGQYNEAEYEMIKLHAEVGAAIIHMLTGNQRAASFVRLHHERVDGNGYPDGLVGEEIPLGARIIAVVQVFLAKINRRGMRDPLPFAKALRMLQEASGTQLDGRVVDALLAWLEERRRYLEP